MLILYNSKPPVMLYFQKLLLWYAGHIITFRLNYLAETVVITPHSATHCSMHPQATLNPNPLSQELVRSHTEAVELRDEASAERQQRQLLQEASASGVYVRGGGVPLIRGPFSGGPEGLRTGQVENQTEKYMEMRWKLLQKGLTQGYMWIGEGTLENRMEKNREREMETSRIMGYAMFESVPFHTKRQ